MTSDQTSILAAIEDLLKAVSVLETYDSVVGLPPRNTAWRAVVDLIRYAVTREQISPARVQRILQKNGFERFQVSPQGTLSYVHQDSNQLACRT
jgi:citrate lyase synthetase